MPEPLSDVRTWVLKVVNFSRASFSLFSATISIQKKFFPKDWDRAIKNCPLAVNQVKDTSMIREKYRHHLSVHQGSFRSQSAGSSLSVIKKRERI